MAFGDHRRVQNAIDYQGNLSQNHLNNLRDIFIPQNQNIWNRFQVAADRGEKDYGDLQNAYGSQGDTINSYLNGPGIHYNPSNQNFGAYGGYEDFSKTGGYSGQNIQDIRARSLAPLRATYANAQNDLDRRNVLAGGNLANIGAAKAKMTRELGYGLSDQSTNVEAQLAQDIRQGKLAGLAGMTGIDTSRMGEGLQNAQGNLTAQGMDTSRIANLLGLGNQNLSGRTSLYGATPGMANMYGNQVNQSNQNLVSTQQLQQQLMQAILQGTLGMARVPGNTQSALGNIGSVLNLVGQVGGMFGGMGGLGGGMYKTGSGSTPAGYIGG
jgi:hypothetical protein